MLDLRLRLPAECFFVLVTYLDDSDSDMGPVLTIGGILIPADQIESFEKNLEKLFIQHKVDVLHTKNFAHRKKEFSKWTAADKDRFANSLFAIARTHRVKAIASTLNKRDFKVHYSKSEGMENMSPIGYAFGKIISALLLNTTLPAKPPISFMIESGNHNNANIVSYYDWFKHNILVSPDLSLGSLTIIDKKSCRAIQVADFIAFYSRKAAEGWDKEGYPRPFTNSDMMNLISYHIEYKVERSFGPVKRVVDSAEVQSVRDDSASWFPSPGWRGIGSRRT